ncbi:hypothetical protein DL767_001873 [Monosporascus sp. MG133]|nr:hypothetical protein DL767_001873 [Monosporascus sp. MG133]
MASSFSADSADSARASQTPPKVFLGSLPLLTLLNPPIFVAMKILIVGASGMIGGEVLIQCLAHLSISSVVAFVRRDLPPDVSGHPKLECVLVKDFSVWPEDVLQAHADAAAMIWNMGTNTGSLAADLEYPLAFLESMARGLLETRALAFAESHATIWETFIVKPGGVATKKWIAPGVIAAVLGENWCIRIEELGAFMTYLAINGEGEDSLIENARIVRKGRELLELQKNSSES